MKTSIIFLTVIVAASVSAISWAWQLPQVLTPDQPTNVPSAASIRIEHQWYAQNDGVMNRMHAYGLGTVVGPTVILTHNHFNQQLGTLTDEVMLFTDPTGQTFQIPVANLALVAVDEGTMLIYLPTNVVLNTMPVSDPAIVEQLTSGDWLTVNYWDDATSRIAQQRFQIVQVEQGNAKVADPQRLIKPGDSGGGVYFEGKLVGNNWSINANNDVSVGTFNVALLPDIVTQLVEPAVSSANPDVASESLLIEQGDAK